MSSSLALRHQRNQDAHHDAADSAQPWRVARPAGGSGPRRAAGRQERAAADAPGPLHVLRHHPAAAVYAAAAGSSAAVPVRARTLKRPSAYIDCRRPTNNRSPACRNVWGNNFAKQDVGKAFRFFVVVFLPSAQMMFALNNRGFQLHCGLYYLCSILIYFYSSASDKNPYQQINTNNTRAHTFTNIAI